MTDTADLSTKLRDAAAVLSGFGEASQQQEFFKGLATAVLKAATLLEYARAALANKEGI